MIVPIDDWQMTDLKLTERRMTFGEIITILSHHYMTGLLLLHHIEYTEICQNIVNLNFSCISSIMHIMH